MDVETFNTQQYYNGEFSNNSNIVQLRLNTEPLLERIEFFLRGAVQKYIETDEAQGFISVPAGKAKANEEGIQSILSHITGVINSQTVQGNFNQETFDRYIEEVNLTLIEMLVINAPDWAIRDQDLEGICDFIMHTVEPFMSRTLNNLERTSYGTSMQTIERNMPQKKGFLSFLRGSQQ